MKLYFTFDKTNKSISFQLLKFPETKKSGMFYQEIKIVLS